MFAVIYRAYMKPGLEMEYQQAWRKVATYFVEHRGALGSCLHQAEDGMWLAYSRWPDQATRDASCLATMHHLMFCLMILKQLLSPFKIVSIKNESYQRSVQK